MIMFVRWELRSPRPLLDLRLFGRPSFAIGTVSLVLVYGAATMLREGRGPLAPDRVASLIAEGMVEYAPRGRIRVSAEGLPVLDAVVADLAA